MYSLSSLVSYEPFVERCVDLFINRLNEFAESETGEDIDLSYWFQCYAFDVIGCITYGERFGMFYRVLCCSSQIFTDTLS